MMVLMKDDNVPRARKLLSTNGTPISFPLSVPSFFFFPLDHHSFPSALIYLYIPSPLRTGFFGTLTTDRYHVFKVPIASIIGILCYHEYAKAMPEFSVFSPLLSSFNLYELSRSPPIICIDTNLTSISHSSSAFFAQCTLDLHVNAKSYFNATDSFQIACVHVRTSHPSFDTSCRCSWLPSLRKATNPDVPMAHQILSPRCAFLPLAVS